MNTLRIRPVAGRVVRDPDLHDLITETRTVPDTPFWRRRVRDGDVAPDPSPPAAAVPASQAADASASATTKGSASAKRSTDGSAS